MRILAVDTTGPELSLALGDGARVWRVSRKSSRDQDERLLPALESLLRRAGWKLRDLDGVAVASGPGRFTSIRVGMTFASMLARSLGVPAVSLSRFEGFAQRLRGSRQGDGLYALVFPAPRGESWLQCFLKKEGVVLPAGPAQWVGAGQTKDVLGRFGRGWRLRLCEAPRRRPLRAADLLGPALERLRTGEAGPMRPLYLKPAKFQKARMPSTPGPRGQGHAGK